jgi:hypothetical protein
MIKITRFAAILARRLMRYQRILEFKIEFAENAKIQSEN